MTEKDPEQPSPEPTEDAPAEPGGDDQGKVEKESEESFPASDPPSW